MRSRLMMCLRSGRWRRPAVADRSGAVAAGRAEPLQRAVAAPARAPRRGNVEGTTCPRAAADVRAWMSHLTYGGRAAHVTATERAVELIEIAAAAAADKLASGIIAYDVSEQLVITDAFLLCSATNDRQVRAIVDQIEARLRLAGARPARREGEREGRWVLLDYIDMAIHVQHAEGRVYYWLARLVT